MSVAELNELVARLSAAVGIIMEDTSPIALNPLPAACDEIDGRLRELDEACQDAITLVHAAKVLNRRGIR